MAITVKIPAQLRVATDGEDELEVDGGTVGEALDAVFAAHADLRERITEDGTLRRFVNVYVSGRGHPLSGWARDPALGRRRGDDPAGRRWWVLSRRPRPGRDPLRRAWDPPPGADSRDPEGAGGDRRPADPLARDPDLRARRAIVDSSCSPAISATRSRRSPARRRICRAGIELECVDTGLDTQTGGRVAAAAARLEGGRFCLTYADGVADIDLAAQAQRARASSGRPRR